MNCRPGDLAIIFKDADGFTENIGAIVRVLDADYADPGEWRCVCDYREILSIGIYTGIVEWLPVGEEFWQEDADMKPLRPGDEADETLYWCPVPSKPQEVA